MADTTHVYEITVRVEAKEPRPHVAAKVQRALAQEYAGEEDVVSIIEVVKVEKQA